MRVAILCTVVLGVLVAASADAWAAATAAPPTDTTAPAASAPPSPTVEPPGKSNASPADAAPKPSGAAAEAAFYAWMGKIRLIEIRDLRPGDEKLFQEGRRKVLDIQDEAAIGPMVQVLYGTNTRYRSLLLESLGQFGQSGSMAAKAYLQEMAVGDGNAGHRRQAVQNLRRASGGPPTERLMAHLALDEIAILRDRAAQALAALDERRAVWLLVERLVTDEVRAVGVEINNPQMQSDLAGQLCGVPTFRRYTITAAVPGGVASYTVELPTVSIVDFRSTIGMSVPGQQVGIDYQRVQVQHPDILAALKTLTRKDFGYDPAAWRKWLESPEASKVVPPWQPVLIKSE